MEMGIYDKDAAAYESKGRGEIDGDEHNAFIALYPLLYTISFEIPWLDKSN